MATYNIYGIGAALVDTEIEVSDAFLASAHIDKGVIRWLMSSGLRLQSSTPYRQNSGYSTVLIDDSDY